MTSLSELKKRSSDIGALQSKFKNKKEYENKADDRFWSCTLQDDGTGSATIRFLPTPQGDDAPFIKRHSHGFQEPSTGRWFIENCPSTIGGKNPVLEENTRLWNSGIESDKEIVRRRKRKTKYIANILVVRDPAKPENEGKVFLFEYNIPINKKIEEALVPKFEDDQALNVFDPWNGADFKLRITRKDKWANYDTSSFDFPRAVGTDEEIEEIWKQEHPLSEFLADENYKSYDELLDKFKWVTGEKSAVPSTTAESDADRASEPVDEDLDQALNSIVNDTPAVQNNSSDDDVDLEELMKLVE